MFVLSRVQYLSIREGCRGDAPFAGGVLLFATRAGGRLQSEWLLGSVLEEATSGA